MTFLTCKVKETYFFFFLEGGSEVYIEMVTG